MWNNLRALPVRVLLQRLWRGLGLLSLVCAAGSLADAHALDCPPLESGAASLPRSQFDAGLLFRVTGSGGVNHVMGTIHVSDFDSAGVLAAARTVLGSSSDFLSEISFDAAGLLSASLLMFYTDGRGLSDEVGDEVAGRAAELLAGHQVPAVVAGMMKPWAVYMTLSLPAGGTPVPLDMLLMQEAQQAGLDLHALETAEEQAQIFEELPQSEQVELLTYTVCHYDALQAQLQEVINTYVRGDLHALLEKSLGSPEASQQEFVSAILWDRNDRMVERMLPYLDEGGAFVAVGAAHLPGDRGLLEQLANRGFRVERVY